MYRDSVLAQDEPIEIVQFRRRNSLVIEEGKPLEPLKQYDHFEDIRLSDDVSQKGAEETGPDNVIVKGNELGVAPDGGYGWIIVFCSFCLNFIVDGITLTEGQLHTPLVNAAKNTENEFGEAEVSWVNGCLTGVTLLVGPLASVMVNRFGFRVTVIAGALIAAFGILMSWGGSPGIPNIYVLVIFYGIVAGIGFGLIFSPSVVIVTHYFDSNRALATGIAICGTGMGTLGMAPLGSALIRNFGWSGTIHWQAAIVLLCVVFGAFFVQPPTVPPLRKLFARTEVGVEGHEQKRRPSVVLTISQKFVSNVRRFVPFFLSPTYMILASSGAITMLGFFSPFAFTPSRTENDYGQDDHGELCLQIMGISNVVARVVFGFLSDRPWTNNLLMSNTALTIAGLATGLSFLIESYWLFVMYCGVFGLCIGCFATLRSILILEFIGLEKMNDGFGLSLTFMGVASLFSSPIAGYLIKLSDGYALAFQTAGFFLLLSAILCYPLRYVAAWEKSYGAAKEKHENQ